MSITQSATVLCPFTEQLNSRGGQDLSLDGLVATVSRLRAKPDLLQTRLRSLLSHPDRLDSVARQSYWHRNGFAKVKFIERDNFCVRLHIWPPGNGRVGDVDPHGHRWDFASWVVVGAGLTETYFARTNAASPAASPYVRFDYGRAGGSAYLRSQKPAWLRENGRRHRLPGEVYGCSRRILHTVAPCGDDLVATMVLQGPVVARSTSVFRYGSDSSDTHERPIGVDELRTLFGAVEAAIGGTDQL